MKRILAIVFLAYCFATLTAQDDQIGILFIQNFSTLRFIDSEGNKHSQDISIRFGYGISYKKACSDHFFVEGRLSYNHKGSVSTLGPEQLDLSFHYMNAGMNLWFKPLTGKLCPQAGAGIYYGRLLKADQTLGVVHYDLLASDDIHKDDFGIQVFAGIDYVYSDFGSLFLGFSASAGLLQLEGKESTQNMYNRTYSIEIGLAFNIKK